MKRNSIKKKAAFALSLLMTAYSSQAGEIAVLNNLYAEGDDKAAESVKENNAEKFDGTADIYIENVTCSDGEKAVVSVGVVDWDQDISSVELTVSYQSGLTLNSVKSLAGTQYTNNENTVTLKSDFSGRSESRGRLAELTFSVPSVEMKSNFEVSVKSAVIKNSKGEEYKVGFSSGIITVDSSLKPLNFEAYEINSHSVGLGWVMKSHLDYTDGYIIYRDDTEIARTSDMNWSDNELETGKTYKYTVKAYGEDGYESSLSDVLEVTPVAASVEDISFTKQYGSVGGKKTTVSFSMSGNTHFSEFNVYSILSDGSASSGMRKLIYSGIDFSSAGGDFEWDLSNTDSADYTIEINAKDIDGTEIKGISDTVNVDNTAPEPVFGFTALTGDESVTLTWGKSAQLNTEKYRIYKRSGSNDYELLTEVIGRDNLSFKDTEIDTGKTYYYNITACDCFGNESEMTEDVLGMSQEDKTPPDIVIFRPDSGNGSMTVISGTTEFYAESVDNLEIEKTVFYISEDDGKTWTEANVSEEKSGVKGYNKWSFDTTSLTSGSVKEKNIKVKVVAYDKAGNPSSDVNIKSYHIDNQPPAQVKNVTVYDVLDETATVSWDDVEDADRNHFEVILKDTTDFTEKKYTVNDTNGINLSSLKSDCKYSVSVCAVDNSGNAGQASEAVEFTTNKDLKAPTINSVSPAPGAYNKKIDITASASDSNAVSKIVFKISFDGEEFTDLESVENKDVSRSFNASCSIDLSDKKDGLVYVRAYAYDPENNESAPYTVQYMIDRKAPDKLNNINITAGSNYLNICWDNNDLSEADHFRIFKLNEETKEFELYKDNISSVNCIDYDVAPEKTYSYKVSVVDNAGNESELSEPVQFSMPADEAPPVIERVTPDTGRTLNPGNKTITFTASDDYKVSKMKISFYSEEGKVKEYTELKSIEPDETVGYISADIPDEELLDKNKIHVLVEATDLFEHSAKREIVYEVDNDSTVIIEVNAEFKEDNSVLRFKAKEIDSTLGYKIYRRPAGENNKDKWVYVGAIPKDNDKNGEYEFTDISAIDSGEYIYKVVSENSNYTRSEKAADKAVEIVRSPEVELGCETYLEKGIEYKFDGTGTNDYYGIASMTIDFGDGTKKTVTDPSKADFIHSYAENGEYDVVLTAENVRGVSASVTQRVSVTERSLMGQVTVNVKTTDGSPAAGVYVYTDVNTPMQSRKKTDSLGRVTFNSVTGNHAIGVYADGYLPDIKNYMIVAGTNADINIPIVHEDIITADFDVTRMTLKEIKSAGIDINSYENNYAYKIDVKLFYNEQPVSGSIISGGGLGGDGYEILAFAGFDIKVPPGKTNSNPTKIEPVAAIVNEETKEVDTLILLELPIEGSMLKEFFDVKLHIINNASSEFSLKDNVVILDIPEGLSLVDLPAMDKLVSTISEIKGQTQKTLNWVIRGDKKGSYNLEAEYSGTLSKFNETVKRKFESDPIEVYGSEVLNVALKVPKQIENNEMYCTLVLTNSSEIDINNVKAKIGDFTSRAFGNFNNGPCRLVQATLCAGGKETYIDFDNVVDTLHTGETLKLKYYLSDIFANSTDKDHPFNFDENTIYLMRTDFDKKGDDVPFSIVVAEDNDNDVRFWYDHMFDEANYEALTTDPVSILAYRHLLDDKALGFDKLIPSLKDSSFISDIDERWDDKIDFLFNFEFDDATDKDKRDYIRNVILKTLNNCGLEEKIQDDYLEHTDSTFEKIVQKFSDYTGEIDDVKSIIDDDKDLIEAAGIDIDDLKNIMEQNGPSAVLTEIKNKINALPDYHLSSSTSNVLDSAWLESVGESVSEDYCDALNIADIVISEIQEADAVYQEMKEIQMLKSTDDVTEKVLSVLENAVEIDPSNPMSSIIESETEQIRKEISSNVGIEILKRIDETQKSKIVSIAGSGAVSKAIEAVANGAVSTSAATGAAATGTAATGAAAAGAAVPGAIAVLIYDLAGIGYNSILQEDVDNKYSERANILADDAVRQCIKEAIENETDISDKMTLINYLLNITICEEQAVQTFFEGTASDGFKKEYIDTIILYIITELMSDDSEASAEYAKQQVEQLRNDRFDIFQCRGIKIQSDGSKEIAFDYSRNQTVASYSSDYEYSIDTGTQGHNWIPCTGKPVVVEPSDKSTHLFIRYNDKNIDKRIKEGQMELLVKPQEYLDGEFSVRYVDGYYYVDKCPQADMYQIFFSNSKEVSEEDWANVPLTSGISKVYKSSKSFRYAHIRKAATNHEPASLSKNVEILKKVFLNTGANSGGTVTGGGHYDINSTVKLKAVPDKGNTFAGWMKDGKIISKEQELSYTVTKDELIYAKFLKTSDYNITLSTNVEKAVVSASNMDGNDSVYIAMVEYDETELIFDHWEDQEGNIVSYLEIYPFIVTDPEEKMELKAIFEEM